MMGGRPRVLNALVYGGFTLAACASPRPATAPVPAPAAPAPTVAVTPVTPAPTPAPAAPAPRTTLLAAPADWHLLDPATDGVAGVAARRALTELLGNAAPKRVITVAVIDGGVDTAHTALRAALVLNQKESAANGRDDDGNGYVDDARGWNFIGGAAGNIDDDRLEVTRLVAACRANGGKSPVVTPCTELEQEYSSGRAEAESQWSGMRPVLTEYDALLETVAKDNGMSKAEITDATLGKLVPKTAASREALERMRMYAANGLTPNVARTARKQVEGRLNYGFNLAFDGRKVIGDTPAMGRRYGNANVTGPDASHGTAVASLIGAVSGDSGFVGIAPGVRILPVRVVPNGDEYDKDVANGIRYAVDAGAQIINMSFGKPYSPGKAMVDSAVQYAVSKGVLLVHASGNESTDVDATPTFPSSAYATGSERAATWIDVGASSWRAGERLAADFTNYGSTRVDLFAPGVSVYAAAPRNEFAREDGTSVAAPVVSGVAALLMSQFPTLTAADVKRILMATVTKFPDQQVLRPGSRTVRVPFATLSASGGIINAYEAVKMAQRETAKAQ
ncbi:MAG: S8 family serine peptidase [Gemmatimonadota bacterium]